MPPHHPNRSTTSTNSHHNNHLHHHPQRHRNHSDPTGGGGSRSADGSPSAASNGGGGGLGYAYHLPAGGLLMRVRRSLAQFTDLFSEFSRFLAPAYHHDRCERSVHMRLYSMHKREFVAVCAAFVTCFGLATLIGLAGPPITRTTEVSATALLSNTTAANDRRIMATGPFVLRSPLMTTYSQQLWLMARVETGNRDDERFDKSFQVGVLGGGGGGGAGGVVRGCR